MDQNQRGQGHGRRHYQRGRRGPDRRPADRRAPKGQEPTRGHRSDVDVDQIMREIRARIAQRHGVELSSQQVHDLATRRLESILDLRTVRPALLDQLRRAAGTPLETDAAPTVPAPYEFDDSTLYESSNAAIRVIRRLLNPILKLFLDPDPLVRALRRQAQLNSEALARDAARDERQAEWNALHYSILQKVVTEVSRVSLEVQSLSLLVESLSAKVDFGERRVREVEAAVHQIRSSGSLSDRSPAARAPAPFEGLPAAVGDDAGQSTDLGKRRRRRRRGRRTGLPAAEISAAGPGVDTPAPDVDAGEDDAVEAPSGITTTDVTSPSPPQTTADGSSTTVVAQLSSDADRAREEHPTGESQQPLLPTEEPAAPRAAADQADDEPQGQ